MRLMIATSGTGGHIFPAVAVAERLLERHPESKVMFVGDSGGMAERIITSLGYDFHGIAAVKLARAGLSSYIKAPFVLPAMAFDSIFGLLKFGPDVVLGAGGYASGASVVAAYLNRIPVALLEQNAKAGRTNRILAGMADRIFLAFAQAKSDLPAQKCITVGNPLRAKLINGASTVSYNANVDSPVLLVIGGSQGARAINMAVVDALPKLKETIPNLHIIHQTGELDFDTVKESYAKAGFENATIEPFFENMEEIYARATLAISRAGAGVLFELALFGVPSVVVPFPYAADDHQLRNAETYCGSGAGSLLVQDNLTSENLLAVVTELIKDGSKLEEMSSSAQQFARFDAADVIVDELMVLADEPTSPFVETEGA